MLRVHVENDLYHINNDGKQSIQDMDYVFTEDVYSISFLRRIPDNLSYESFRNINIQKLSTTDIQFGVQFAKNTSINRLIIICAMIGNLKNFIDLNSLDIKVNVSSYDIPKLKKEHFTNKKIIYCPMDYADKIRKHATNIVYRASIFTDVNWSKCNYNKVKIYADYVGNKNIIGVAQIKKLIIRGYEEDIMAEFIEDISKSDIQKVVIKCRNPCGSIDINPLLSNTNIKSLVVKRYEIKPINMDLLMSNNTITKLIVDVEPELADIINSICEGNKRGSVFDNTKSAAKV